MRAETHIHQKIVRAIAYIPMAGLVIGSRRCRTDVLLVTNKEASGAVI